MPNYGESFLSKILDEGNILPFKRYGVSEDDFASDTEKDVYKFIVDYAYENRNKTPDYRTVVEHYPDFYYREGVSDSYQYLARQLKSFTAKRKIVDLVSGVPGTKSLEERLNSEDGNELIHDLVEELSRIGQVTDVRDKVGKSLKDDGDEFISEYTKRKIGESFKIWLSKFTSINNSIGGYYSGNMYVWFGRSGRGKSVFVMEEALEAAFQGATVLIWALEMSWFEWFARAYASVSARNGMFNATIKGVNYEAGFENNKLLRGNLGEEWEGAFKEFLEGINEIIDGEIIVRAIDDEDFVRRDVRQLESDIITTNADVVVVDPFYYMDYETNTSNTKGGAAAETSKKLRALSGRTQVVLHAITQAEEDDKEEYGHDGVRELNPPNRAGVKKTKQLLEDAVNLFAIDTSDGRGVIRLGKGRNGGEDDEVEVVYLPNYGIVREIDYTAIETEIY